MLVRYYRVKILRLLKHLIMQRFVIFYLFQLYDAIVLLNYFEIMTGVRAERVASFDECHIK